MCYLILFILIILHQIVIQIDINWYVRLIFSIQGYLSFRDIFIESKFNLIVENRIMRH